MQQPYVYGPVYIYTCLVLRTVSQPRKRCRFAECECTSDWFRAYSIRRSIVHQYHWVLCMHSLLEKFTPAKLTIMEHPYYTPLLSTKSIGRWLYAPTLGHTERKMNAVYFISKVCTGIIGDDGTVERE